MGEAARREGRQRLEIHRLSPGDVGLLQAHFLRLDPVTRYERFGMSVNDNFLMRYAAHCFDGGDLVFGYFAEGVLRGAGELRGLGRSKVHEAAEAAFSVEKAWRGRGAASALLDRTIETAHEIGAKTLFITCVAQNRAMQKLVRGCGRQWRESFSDNAYFAVLDLVEAPGALRG